MRTRVQRITRRGVVAAAGLAVASAVLFNVPAQANHEVCGPLQASYIANPEARPQLLGPLQTFGCTVPNTGSSTSSSSTSSSTSTSTSTPTSTSTSTSTTSTTLSPEAAGCAGLQSTFLTNVDSRPVLLPLLQSLGCTVPGSSTTSSSTSSTTSSSTSTSTSSTSTSTTVVTTIPADAGCASLLLAFNAAPETQSQLLPVLQALGCTIPNGSTT